MSDTTYSSPLLRPQGSPVVQLLRELYAATPLAIFLAALRPERAR